MAALEKVTFYGHVDLDFSHVEKREAGQNANIFVNNYRPQLSNYTRSLITFEGGNNSDGVSDNALGYTFSVYRLEEGEKTLRPIYSSDEGKLSIIDYNIRNNKKYQYYIFKEDETSISKALLSNSIETCWWDYSVSGLQLVDAETNTYKINVEDVWLFNYNLSSSSTSQNFSKTVYNNLTRFPQVSVGKSNYSSGSFSGLIGIFKKDKYVENPELVEKWNEFCANKCLKLLKDRKGHKYIVSIQSTSSQIADETREQATTVSVDWTQVGDADDYVIIGD